MKRQKQQHGHLRRERLGAGDADLGAGVEIDAAVGLAGDRAADRVDDRQGRVSAALGFSQGAQRVRRFARLAQHEDQRPIVERGVAVAKLAGELDLDRQVCEPLDQVFAHQRRVPARPARREDDPPHAAELAGREVQPAELRGRLGPAQPAAAGVDHGLGLLANLLDHVVGVAAELDRVGLPVDPIDPRRDRPMLEVADLEVARRQPNDLAVLQKRHPRRVRRDGHRVAGQQVLAFAQPDDQRAAKPGADDLAGPLRADHRQPVSSLEPRQGPLQRDRTGRRPIPARVRSGGRRPRYRSGSRNTNPCDSSSRRSAAWFSITPLCTTATVAAPTRPPRCGWALRSVAGP